VFGSSLILLEVQRRGPGWRRFWQRVKDGAPGASRIGHPDGRLLIAGKRGYIFCADFGNSLLLLEFLDLGRRYFIDGTGYSVKGICCE
jgi:hypothetical protein